MIHEFVNFSLINNIKKSYEVSKKKLEQIKSLSDVKGLVKFFK